MSVFVRDLTVAMIMVDYLVIVCFGSIILTPIHIAIHKIIVSVAEPEHLQPRFPAVWQCDDPFYLQEVKFLRENGWFSGIFNACVSIFSLFA